MHFIRKYLTGLKMSDVTLNDGKILVKLARKFIEAHFSNVDVKIPDLELLNEERGIFVTLKRYPSNELRGCIGYIEGIMPLRNAIKEIAILSAFRDPRFPPIRREELEHLIVEVSILTPPELIKVKNPEDYLHEIEIGRDGLIAEFESRRGLLLPQVPVEWKWNEEEFLSHTCMKAGLSSDSWKNLKVKIYKFKAEVFSEEEPNGKVIKVEL